MEPLLPGTPREPGIKGASCAAPLSPGVPPCTPQGSAGKRRSPDTDFQGKDTAPAPPGRRCHCRDIPRGASRARRKSRSLPGNIPPPGHPYRLSQKLLPTGLTPREPRMLPRGSVRPFLRLPRGMSREASPGASCRVPLKSGAPPAASEPPRERLLRLIARTAALWCGLQEEDG